MIRVFDTNLKDLRVIESNIFRDDRGRFRRMHCKTEFHSNGLPSNFPQSNIVINNKKGVLRGLHFQQKPYGEHKLVQCIKGKILDVVVDLRQHSPTFLESFQFELNFDSGLALMVPSGFAHGYLTLSTNAIVTYHVTESYNPESEKGIRWNDPILNIDWPIVRPTISAKDASWPDFDMAIAQ